MTITFKEDMNPQSVIVKHGILMQAATLITGREGVLETEKELYLILAMIDFLAEENIIEKASEKGKYFNKIIYDLNDVKQYSKAIIDYMSGMTDQYIVRTYNEIISF